MTDWDFILAPSTVTVDIVLDEIAIISNSIKMLEAEDFHSGLHEWISTTSHQLTPEQHEANHQLKYLIDDFAIATTANTYPEFIAEIPTLSPQVVIDGMLSWRRDYDNYPGDDLMLNDQEAYLEFTRQVYAKKHAEKQVEFDEAEHRAYWEMLQNPQDALNSSAEHLQFLWDTYFEAEWKRVKPMLQEAVDAFSQLDYDNMTAYDAIETITGRNMRGKDFFDEKLEKVNHLVFMPNAHLGPYISWGASHDENTMVFLFGARPPKNATVKSTALSRSELLVRLNALADETRLKILEMLTENEELCAQDFITGLDLSQSSASRHLRQLTASGYISERRRDVAKCYSINHDRIDDTIQALKIFLDKN